MYQTITTLIVVALMFGSANATCKGPRYVYTDENGNGHKYSQTYSQYWKAAGISGNCEKEACSGSSNSLKQNVIDACTNSQPLRDALKYGLLAHHSEAHDTALCICKATKHCQKTDNVNYQYKN